MNKTLKHQWKLKNKRIILLLSLSVCTLLQIVHCAFVCQLFTKLETCFCLTQPGCIHFMAKPQHHTPYNKNAEPYKSINNIGYCLCLVLCSVLSFHLEQRQFAVLHPHSSIAVSICACLLRFTVPTGTHLNKISKSEALAFPLSG